MRYEVTRVVPSIVGTFETSEASFLKLAGAKSCCAHRAAGNPGTTYRVREVPEGCEVDGDCALLYEATLEERDWGGERRDVA